MRRRRSAGLKKDQKHIGLCRVFAAFRAEVEKRARKGPKNDSQEQLLSNISAVNHEITIKKSSKVTRGVAKTEDLQFRKNSKIPTYLLWYFDSWKTRFPDFRDFHPKRYN